jgi:hypothetical protein
MIRKFNKIMKFSLEKQLERLDSRLDKISRVTLKKNLKKYLTKEIKIEE